MCSSQSYSLGKPHYSQTVNQNVFEKLNPKSNKIVKVIKGTCNFCGREKSQFFTKWMTRGKDFKKKRKCKKDQCWSMSNSAWCDSHSKRDILKLHEYCYNPKCKCEKQITFTTRKVQLEGAGFEKEIKNIQRKLKSVEFIFQTNN